MLKEPSQLKLILLPSSDTPCLCPTISVALLLPQGGHSVLESGPRAFGYLCTTYASMFPDRVPA